ncbi:N-acetylglucosamine-6-phosphate deacetylase [Entomoplasma freundtii]|uniref:N-acetylglucosamine-6-phosphate deacetylase n=1 Tax=Entomoplasma freundtii TaxID=74700 RepID=A0A2K8NUN3_9MOLU|nr:N-acetylglucosamine-6-phosphate deacetylase [Entomoplasma freundtii]ATZ16333.1 N-acetylglucosamine-6-phosphate deacetylase [Entomoplasma freundtii]TDY56628.1 N-acetylglucosamine-6-phosphate deacetylase [Entomoplasma freundtii]
MLLKNGKIVLENEIIEGYLEIENKRIKAIKAGDTSKLGIDLKGNWILPGFIDVHVHGGYGVDFETGDQSRFQIFAENVGQEGITKYLQASVTNSLEANDHYYSEFGNFMTNQELTNNLTQAKCLGAHLEGPFIDPSRKGAHEEKLLKKPDIALLKRWNDLANHKIKMVTYAADFQDGSFTQYLVNENIIPSIGHTNMTAKDFERDWALGAKHITHLFNGMSGVDQHRPGLAVAGLIHDDVLVEVIADGIHLQPEILRLIYKMKGPQKIAIITDAMNAKGLPDGDYLLGQLPVVKTGMKVALKSSGSLAGAGATFDHNVRTFYNTIKMPMTDLVKMTSLNVAKELKIDDQTGSIAENKLADLVIMDPNLEVQMTVAEGGVIYEKLESNAKNVYMNQAISNG